MNRCIIPPCSLSPLSCSRPILLSGWFGMVNLYLVAKINTCSRWNQMTIDSLWQTSWHVVCHKLSQKFRDMCLCIFIFATNFSFNGRNQIMCPRRKLGSVREAQRKFSPKLKIDFIAKNLSIIDFYRYYIYSQIRFLVFEGKRRPRRSSRRSKRSSSRRTNRAKRVRSGTNLLPPWRTLPLYWSITLRRNSSIKDCTWVFWHAELENGNGIGSFPSGQIRFVKAIHLDSRSLRMHQSCMRIAGNHWFKSVQIDLFISLFISFFPLKPQLWIR